MNRFVIHASLFALLVTVCFTMTACRNGAYGGFSSDVQTLPAESGIPRYTVTYNNLLGGSRGENPTTFTSESLPIELASGTNDVWAFAGWYDNDQFTGDVITGWPQGTTGNKVLYAKWKIDLFAGKLGHTNVSYFGRRIARNATTGNVYVLDDTTVTLWNGTDWQPLPTAGMPGVTTDYGAAIAVDNKNNQNVYYLIESTTDGKTGTYCTKWNGTQWTDLGNQGFGNPVAKTGGLGYTPQIGVADDGTVYALTIKDNTTRTLYRLNGGMWQEVNDTPNLYCGTMCIDGNTVYVTYFETVGGTAYLRVKSWNGTVWSQVGDADVTSNAAWGSYHYVAARNEYVVVGYRNSTSNRITIARKVPNSNVWTSLGNPTTADTAKITDGSVGYFDLGIHNDYPVVFTRDSRIIEYDGSAWQELSQTTTPAGSSVFGTIDHGNHEAWMYIGFSGTIPSQFVKRQRLD